MSGEGLRGPAPRPCASCPYRRDVPSGVWSAEDYEKLPTYDDGGFAPAMFQCHQNDAESSKARMCAGWVATHGGDELISLRLALITDRIDGDTYSAACDYSTDVPMFDSGAEAAEHGLADIDDPSDAAVAMAAKISKTRTDLR